MNVSPPRSVRFAAAVAGFLALAAAAFAEPFYVVSKTQVFVQTTAGGAVPDPAGEYVFEARAGSNVTFTLPSGATQALTFTSSDGGNYTFQQRFATKAAMDAAFPPGTYRMSGGGVPNLSFNLTTDAYPAATPQISGGTWNAGGLLVLNPAQANSLTISPNTSYATSGVAGHMRLALEGVTDNVQIESEIATQAVLGLTGQTTPLTTFAIPAGRLANGRAYRGEVKFDTLTTLDTTSVPNGGAVAIFGRALVYFVSAQATGTVTPAPVIVNQPANVVGVVGGTATFSLNVTVGGSPQFSNLGQRWFFNGAELNLDGTKYAPSPNSFGLRVNNLTTADAGAYSVQLINAGGLVQSNAATLSLGAAPVAQISRQPVAQDVTQGSTVVFTVGAPAGSTYQWRRDGQNLPNATSAMLVIVGATQAQAGTYSVVVSSGGTSLTSQGAALNVLSNFGDPGRLINLSILTPLAAGETMTMGTVLGGGGTTGTKPLLARAAGPSLAPLGVAVFLPDPTMTLNSTSVTPATTVATNNDWAGTAALSAVFTQVGAFAYTGPASKDAAIFQPALAPGNYTVDVRDSGTSTGTVIAELYDATASGTFSATTPRLINVSVRKQINTGGSLTVGFYVGGTSSKTVLIRAIGPTLGLAPFNIPATMPDPQLTLFNSAQVAIAANNDWGGDPVLVNTAGRVGGFGVTNPASKDAILMITLSPGSYTVEVSPAAGTPGGTAIVEVYEVP